MPALLVRFRHFFPVLAFLGGFIWDAVTIGQRVKTMDFWRLGGFLIGAALLIVWMARHAPLPHEIVERAAHPLREKAERLVRLLPYLLLQFFFGGIFSALFILYFKSAGHLGSWLTAAVLGALLVANEFARDRYGQRLALTWSMFALNAILLCNFALPYALGTLDPNWFYVSTALGAGLTHLLWRFGTARRGRIGVAWGIAGALILAWMLGMIAPVPLVRKAAAVGHDFAQRDGRYVLRVEPASFWQPWRDQAEHLVVREGGKLYGVSAVFAPQGITAQLEHRWEIRDGNGWRLVYRNRFQASGGREGGFRGYSWVLDPKPGNWRFIVATQDGRTVALTRFSVERGEPDETALEERSY